MALQTSDSLSITTSNQNLSWGHLALRSTRRALKEAMQGTGSTPLLHEVSTKLFLPEKNASLSPDSELQTPMPS